MYIFLLTSGLALWVAILWAYARTGRASVYHPATYYLAFHGIVFVLRPILAYAGNYSYVYHVMDFHPGMGDKIRALLIANIGMMAFILSSLSFDGGLRMRWPVNAARGSTKSRLNLLVASALCLPLGLISLYENVSDKLSGTRGMIRDAATGIAVNTTSNGYLTDANNMLGIIVALIAWRFRFRAIALLPFVLYSVARLIVGSSRWTFVMTTASVALFYLYDQRRCWLKPRIAILGLATAAVFMTLGMQRDYFRSVFLASPPPVTNAFEYSYLEGMDLANLEYLEFVSSVVPFKTRTYGYFVDNLQVFTEPVPRVLWPSKPIGAPIQYWKLMDYGTPLGITYSLPGEGWMQAGYVGVVFWCGLFGLLFGRAYSWFTRSRQSEIAVALYLCLLPLSIQFFRDGSLLTLLRFPLFFLVPIAVWKALGRLHKRERVAAPGRFVVRIYRRPPARRKASDQSPRDVGHSRSPI
jgi:oligosaccharide repeat unit polymerase